MLLNIEQLSVVFHDRGAAFEAVTLGIPAVALSTPPEYYDGAVNHLEQIYAYFCANKLMDVHRLYNVNIPPQPQGIRITRQGGPYYSDKFPWVAPDMVKADGRCVHVDQNDLTLDTDSVIHGYISADPGSRVGLLVPSLCALKDCIYVLC